MFFFVFLHRFLMFTLLEPSRRELWAGDLLPLALPPLYRCARWVASLRSGQRVSFCELCLLCLLFSCACIRINFSIFVLRTRPGGPLVGEGGERTLHLDSAGAGGWCMFGGAGPTSSAPELRRCFRGVKRFLK